MTQNLGNYGVHGVHGVDGVHGVCFIYLHCRLAIQELNGVEGIVARPIVALYSLTKAYRTSWWCKCSCNNISTSIT